MSHRGTLKDQSIGASGLIRPPVPDGWRILGVVRLVNRLSPYAVSGCLALVLAAPVHAEPTITAAAIAMGRLYVLGTTDRPRTRVSLDGKFARESDETGRFQFELAYYPVGCIVKVAVGDNTIEAVVGQCGDVCKPMDQTVDKHPSPRSEGLALVEPQAPPMTGSVSKTVLPPDTLTAPTLHAPLPPRRPGAASLLVTRTVAQIPAVQPPRSNVRPAIKLKPELTPRQEPDAVPVMEPAGSEGAED